MKKIGILALVLVFVLGTLGVGYAMWDKTLFIDGTVNTGEVDAIFTTAECVEDPEAEGKDVGSCTLTGVGEQTLTITITNGYPCYGCTVNFTVDNIGTIPVKVESFDLSGVPPEITVTWTDLVLGTQIEPNGSVPGDLHIHVLQTADELATYTFSAKILLVQWNESAY